VGLLPSPRIPRGRDEENEEVMYMMQVAMQQAEETMQLAVSSRDNPSTFLA
jgi:hypothetical protein